MSLISWWIWCLFKHCFANFPRICSSLESGDQRTSLNAHGRFVLFVFFSHGHRQDLPSFCLIKWLLAEQQVRVSRRPFTLTDKPAINEPPWWSPAGRRGERRESPLLLQRFLLWNYTLRIIAIKYIQSKMNLFKTLNEKVLNWVNPSANLKQL